MPSRKNSHLVKVEEDEYQILEDEEEANTDVEEETLRTQVEGLVIKTKFKAQAKMKHNVRGMTNLKFNVIIATSMVIMQMNIERSDMLQLANQMQIFKKRKLKPI